MEYQRQQEYVDSLAMKLHIIGTDRAVHRCDHSENSANGPHMMAQLASRPLHSEPNMKFSEQNEHLLIKHFSHMSDWEASLH